MVWGDAQGQVCHILTERRRGSWEGGQMVQTVYRTRAGDGNIFLRKICTDGNPRGPPRTHAGAALVARFSRGLRLG